MRIGAFKVKVFSPEWLFREKVLFQRERKGTPKEATDLRFVHSFDFRVAREGGIDDDQKLTDAL